MINTDKLFGNDFDEAMGELAKLVYEMKEHYKVEYISTSVDLDSAIAYGKVNGKFTEIIRYPKITFGDRLGG